VQIENSIATILHVFLQHGGWWQYYFRSGQLSAEVKFAAGEIVEEKYINEDGTSATREEAFEQPKFPGGDAAMFAFVDERLVYPEAARENGIEGLVVARLIILEDGSVGGAKIIRPLISVCDQVTLDIALQMPDFSVGKQFNRPARVYMNMPLRFNLTPSGKPEESESDN
ncbi:MAG: energy transducer TonB, partial [Bacteroidota bacterium]